MRMLTGSLFVCAVGVALVGCASVDTNVGTPGAARRWREVELGGSAERPVKMLVPAPDVNWDAAQALDDIESRQRAEAASRRDHGRPDLDHDVTQGIQSGGVDRALGR